MPKIIICVYLALIFLQVWGKTEFPRLYFDHLTIDERLSHNTVYCILQDRDGYVWVGTQDGLNKYDGYTFEVYRSNGHQASQDGFVGKTVVAMLEDRAGNLWVGTRQYGLNFRDALGDHFINLQADSAFLAIKGYAISSIIEDRKGLIWISTVGGGVMSYDRLEGRSRHYTVENSGLSDNLAFDIAQDKEGRIWVATAGVGINYLDEAADDFSMIEGLIQGQSNMAGYRKSLCLDGNSLWVGAEGSGLYKLDIQDKSFEHFAYENGKLDLSSNGIRDLYKSENGQLLIATDGGGLNVYDELNDSLYVFRHSSEKINSLNTNALLCFAGDRSGNLWVGTFNGGLNVYKAHKTWFEFISPDDQPSDQLQRRSVLAFCQSHDEKIWVGTDGGGLYQFEPTDNTFSRLVIKDDPALELLLTQIVAKTIIEDSRGMIWIGTFKEGLIRYDPQKQTIEQYQYQFWNPKSLGSNLVWSIDEAKDGQLWIGTLGGGLSVWDPKADDFTVYRPSDSSASTLADVDIMAVLVDLDDNVWIGTGDKGLNLWDDAKQEFLHLNNNPEDSLSISNDEIRTIFQDSKGEIWIGTEGGGLNHWLGNGKFERIDAEDGLIGNNVMSIIEDQDGMLWITTFNGISQLDPNTHNIRSFDFRGGKNSNQFNQLASICTKTGILYFGGIKGLNLIHPAQLKETEEEPNILFTDFKVFNQSMRVGVLDDDREILPAPIEVAKNIYLDYTDNSFSLSFASTDFVNPQENQFEYMMEGFDANWQLSSLGQHSVTYTNLTPGKYQFRLRYRGQEAMKIIHIKPPFWQTTWFRVLTILLIVGGIFLFVLFTIRQRESLHKQEMLKAQGEILGLQNDKLAATVEAKNAQLMFFSVQMAHKNEMLTNIKTRIQEIQATPSTALKQLLKLVDRELKSEDYWSEFNLYFNQVDKDFLQSLQARHPDLTQNDLRICSLIRINLTTKEIASLLNITVRGVEQSRYRLKKRLSLESEDNLQKYIVEFKEESSRKS
ncbi:MAG: two-component regulator propeller domain-containing protein [Bacteroidia bacterium]